MSTENLVDMLRTHPFVEGCKPEHIEKLASMAARVQFEKNAIIFREGDESELGIFFVLMLETCRRQKVSPNPPSENVLKTMWQLFHPKGYLRLFFLHHRDELVSGGLAVTLGDRFLCWKTGWSGKHGNMEPNKALYWYLIKWAKAKKSYRYIDFGSVNRKTALLMKQKEIFPKEIIKTPAFFKLGFGGEVVYLPEASVYIPNVMLNSLYRIACLIHNFLFSRRSGD